MNLIVLLITIVGRQAGTIGNFFFAFFFKGIIFLCNAALFFK